MIQQIYKCNIRAVWQHWCLPLWIRAKSRKHMFIYTKHNTTRYRYDTHVWIYIYAHRLRSIVWWCACLCLWIECECVGLWLREWNVAIVKQVSDCCFCWRWWWWWWCDANRCDGIPSFYYCFFSSFYNMCASVCLCGVCGLWVLYGEYCVLLRWCLVLLLLVVAHFGSLRAPLCFIQCVVVVLCVVFRAVH